jgi:6-phosphofructokinase 1
VNASLAAVVAACQAAPGVARLWGCKLGMHGLVHGNWVDLSALSSSQFATLRGQPGAALGSSRYRTQPEDLPALLELLYERRIGLLLLIGGNGTMAAAHAIGEAATVQGLMVDGSPFRVAGIPKTIDNDLAGTHVAPGYASAARFIAQTTRAVGLDLRAMVDYDQVDVTQEFLAYASPLVGELPPAPVLL